MKYALIACLLGGAMFSVAVAQAAEPTGYAALVERRQKQMFQEVATYTEQNPDAADIEDAYIWLLQNSVAFGLEVEVIPVTERYMKRPNADPLVRGAVRQVRALGLAKAGRFDEAMEIFLAQMKAGKSRSNAQAQLEFALTFANLVQLHGDGEAVRQVYSEISNAFSLIPEVRSLAENKLTRAELMGKKAPEITGDDLQGKALDLAKDYQGKVVLVDFWATWCGPCRAAFPGLKDVYAQYKDKGFEIVGVSLDDDEETVTDYLKNDPLPWRQILILESGGEELVQTYGANTIPALFLIDQQGKVVNFDIKGSDLKTILDQLLSKK